METIQICVAGSMSADKSSLLRRYRQDKYDDRLCSPHWDIFAVIIEQKIIQSDLISIKDCFLFPFQNIIKNLSMYTKDQRKVTTEEAMEYWNEVNVEFSETSAKNSKTIIQLINRIAKDIALDHIFKKPPQKKGDNAQIKMQNKRRAAALDIRRQYYLTISK